MSVWLDSSSNSNKFKQSYFRDFVDVSGDILVRNGLSLKLYNNNIPTRVQFSVNSKEFHIYNDTDQTYYDISNTKLIHLQDLSENVQSKLNQVSTLQSALNFKANIGDIDVSFTSVNNAIATKANALNADLTGIPTAPTASYDNSSNQLATTGFVAGGISTYKAIVDNSFTSANTAIATKANALDASLAGTPLAPTANAGTNSTQIATTAFVKIAVDNLLASAPEALDTLKELASALNNDASFSTNVTNTLATKAPIANPNFTGTVTATKVSISSDASFSGRVDVCGNFYAKYPASSIPSSAIIGGVPTNSVDMPSNQTISGVKTFTNGLNVGSISVSSVAGNPTFQRVQIGQDIAEGGQQAEAYFGHSVSMNSDGTIVAIGAHYADGTAGRVCVYKKVGSTWTRLGQIIVGKNSGDFSGISVSLSSDGTIVAIGADQNDGTSGISDDNRGHVRVYKYNGSTTWTQLGQDIYGENATDYSGASVSLSSDGTIVAIGAWGNAGVTGAQTGHVRVYQYNGSTTWTKLGEDIDGEASPDNSGTSVSLSSDGTIVAIGAPYNDGTAENAGHVRVYQYNGSTTWTKLGQDIDGQIRNDYFGKAVSLSSDGTILAIGAYESDVLTGEKYGCGRVRVYKYNGSTWTQLGQNIDGEERDDASGFSVSLSSDGTILAIGAYANDGTTVTAGQYSTDNRGHVRIYQYSGTTWTQLGSDIDGKAAGDNSGRSVSLSKDGAFVAIGAPYADIPNGNSAPFADCGLVSVYQIRDLTVTKLIVNNAVDICGNLYAQYAAASIPASAISGISTSIQTALNLKASLASPDLTGTPTAPTANSATNSTQIATTAFVKSAVDNLVASAPGALDTLKELASALNNDASFSTTVTNSLASKAALANPIFTGTVTATKVSISSDASFSGRVDVCGNFYAKYPQSSIPASAIYLATDISINSLTVGRGGGNDLYNTAVGYRALASNTTGGVYNTAVGYQALASTTSGNFNTAVGMNALQNNTSGAFNVAVGTSALGANTTGNYNIALNWGALLANTIGNDNIALGKQALNVNQTGSNNIAIGTLALQNSTSSNSSAIGWSALQSSTGTANTAFGYLAGGSNTTGEYNTFIGYGADTSGTSFSNSTAIGANAKITTSNQIALGTSSETVYMPGKLSAGDASFSGRVDICGNFYAQYPPNSIPASAIIGGVGGGAYSSIYNGLVLPNISFVDSFAYLKEIVVDPNATIIRQFQF
jgi:hypothetical protein